MQRSVLLFLAAIPLSLLSLKAARGFEPTEERAAAPRFELKDGDRVVFLGNTLIEREQKYGYWETMLTARYPDRNITFRNLGWDGDTVWAESRGIFDPPQVGYARMIEQIKGLQPTVIFLGYGNNEAFAGQEGLAAFETQLRRLLTDLNAMGARLFILSPLRREDVGDRDQISAYNAKAALYADALQKAAETYGAVYLDIFTRFLQRHQFFQLSPEMLEDITHDGFHLTQTGYLQLASCVFAILRIDNYQEMTLSAEGNVESEKGVKVRIEKHDPNRIRFTVEGLWLPEPIAPSPRFLGVIRPLIVGGLRDEKYSLKIDGQDIPIASPKPLPTPNTFYFVVKAGPEYEHVERLRRAIIAKNELYFHSWRPQNVTYLFGFRKHEQGQNAKETAEFEKLVAEKEAEIAKLRKPVPHKYELIRVEP